MACSTARKACLKSRLFPPDEDVEWETGHERLERRRLKRVTVTPEEIGLCGCWQVIAVRRERIHLGTDPEEPSDEISYYVTSVAEQELSDEQLLAEIRNHWSAIENGVHYRRDVTFGEDASRIAQRSAAHAMAALRNLAIGIFELESDRERVTAKGCKSWCRQMTFSSALALLRT